MALKKYSAINYGHTITKNNRYINFIEPNADNIELSAVLDIGGFTLTTYANRLAKALNTAGTQEYTVDVDRTTGRLTISSTDIFTLLVDTGSQKTVSAFTISGFTGSDLSGADNYESDSRSGSVYITQTPLHNFSDFPYNKEKSEAQVRTTPAGITEVVSYSVLQRLKCDLPLITNYIPQRYIRATATGVDEAEAFMDYAITKAPLEFIYDYQDPDVFVSCILDKTKQSREGVGYELVERVKDELPGYYELTGLVFLRIEVQ